MMMPTRLPRFDNPPARRKLEQYLADADRVGRHAFYPFIAYDKVIPRYKKDEHKVRPKIRPIRYASYWDTEVYKHYAALLSDAYEAFLQHANLGDSVIAYRKLGKSNIDFAGQVFDYIRRQSSCVAVGIDIREFFESLQHRALKSRWQSLIGSERLPVDHYNVFKSVTRYAYVNRRELYKALGVTRSERRRRICSAREFREVVRRQHLIRTNDVSQGIPQGSPISAVLSNVYMMEFDTAVDAFAKARGGIYRRYSDDILVVLPGEQDPRETLEYIEDQLAQNGLVMNREKVEVVGFWIDDSGRHTADGALQYLGFTFDGAKVLVRSKSLSRYHRRLRRYIRVSERKAIRAGSTRLRRRRLLVQFTMRGRRNFIAYAQRADRTLPLSGIRGQVASHWGMVRRLLNDADATLRARQSGSDVIR